MHVFYLGDPDRVVVAMPRARAGAGPPDRRTSATPGERGAG